MSAIDNEKIGSTDSSGTELAKVKAELTKSKAELATIKRRFGVDKEEEFLEIHANISLKDYAKMLHGRDCEPNLSPNELLLAKMCSIAAKMG
jgi:hypothetical protein